jgi:hypothetical protein
LLVHKSLSKNMCRVFPGMKIAEKPSVFRSFTYKISGFVTTFSTH